MRYDSGGSGQTEKEETDDLAFSVLEKIFDELAEAYRTANEDVGGYTLSSRVFETENDLEKFVSSYLYRTNALCFAIGWKEF